ncbi:DUF5906 domain-containing protein [bacterium]|nr:DUF5906 domain-containing protein [bacterium]
MIALPPGLAAFAAYNQFIMCQVVPDTPKARKLPIDHRTGSAANAHDPAIHLDINSALRLKVSNPQWLIGFVFTKNDPFYFLDIDNCAVDGAWEPIVQEMVNALPGAAVEISQSGVGIHIFGSYVGAAPLHSCKNIPRDLELYTADRFVMLTGNVYNGVASADNTAALGLVISQNFPPTVAIQSADWTTEPSPEWRGPEDNAELLKRFLAQKATMGQVFHNEPTNRQLWYADADALGLKWPDGGGQQRAFDGSSADASLASRLAFWTGGDCARIEVLMRESELYRDKYEREDYLYRTITYAVSICADVYKDPRTAPPIAPRPIPAQVETVDSTPIRLAGVQMLDPEGQIKLFEGCMYIQSENAVLTPTGLTLGQGAFDATYGGYTFMMGQDVKDTRKAWEAYTQSQAVRYAQVEKTCFKPLLAPGSVIVADGIRSVNTYVPIDTPCVEGDVSMFLTFLAKLLPDANDRAILLSFMATCVQHKGFKIKWAPLLIGTKGNGKTLITTVMVKALGQRYSHMAPADKLDAQFNSWLASSLFIGVEDIYVPEARSQLLETLKPMITAGFEGLSIEKKGVDQGMSDICCNFLFNSNHEDAMRITEGDRRYCVFYTAQSKTHHLARDGMDGMYFPELYGWLDNGGYANVTHYLSEYAVPVELDPRGAAHRAPETTTTSQAIQQSLGAVEQEVEEAIAEGRPGFCGGWISGAALEVLIVERRFQNRMPIAKRKRMLEGLGYYPHAGLDKGRANRATAIDAGRKPRLFVTKGHLSLNITDKAFIVDAYEKAQAPGAVAAMGAVFKES